MTGSCAHMDDEAIQRPRPRLLLLVPVLVILLAEAAYQALSAFPYLRDLGVHARLPAAALIFAVLNLVATVGLVSGMRFGWILAMSLAGWNVGYFLVMWWIGEPGWIGMALAVAVVFLLSSREMRRAYQADAQ
jgi:hypothetical protein